MYRCHFGRFSIGYQMAEIDLRYLKSARVSFNGRNFITGEPNRYGTTAPYRLCNEFILEVQVIFAQPATNKDLLQNGISLYVWLIGRPAGIVNTLRS